MCFVRLCNLRVLGEWVGGFLIKNDPKVFFVILGRGGLEVGRRFSRDWNLGGDFQGSVLHDRGFYASLLWVLDL